MLYIATQLQIFTVDHSAEQVESLKTGYLDMKEVFKERTVQSLVLARYTKGGPYVLETLITLLVGEFVLLKDGANDGRLLINMILQLAIKMGLHRNSAGFGLSSFEGEMRKRVWIVILQLDLTMSMEMGLPRSSLPYTHTDVTPPLNLYDSDFDEDIVEMPLPRPETEWTPILPLIARGRLISALGPICDINANLNLPSSDDLYKLDALLEDARYSIPSVLQWRPVAITDSPNLVVQRVSVETTYHKARILLYRRALIGRPCGRTQEPDKKYVQICLDSALKILSFQELLHEESQPFGRLSQLRWKVIHIFNQDVLLATSVLCLYLQDIDKFELHQSAGQTTLPHKAEEIRERLSISHKIWLSMSSASVEAAKVAKALTIVLEMPEPPTEKSNESTNYDFMDFDAMSVNENGISFNDQCEESVSLC